MEEDARTSGDEPQGPEEDSGSTLAVVVGVVIAAFLAAIGSASGSTGLKVALALFVVFGILGAIGWAVVRGVGASATQLLNCAERLIS